VTAFDRLHPGLQHHIVNTLGWPGLRPLQAESVEPLLAGSDALLLAPTAGGKTEAAMFPLLSRMAAHGWTDVSVLYLAPLRALLNNLEGRLSDYAGWLGRSAAVWHGDVLGPQRRKIQRERPDILLTTPESLESMLVSEKLDSAAFFSGLRAVVIDEVHAFAGDDRGWHLQAVLARLEHLLGRPLQRIGMSATVGNPAELLVWLQGFSTTRGPGAIVFPDAQRAADAAAVSVDLVGTVGNAAKVISALHEGEKCLVFVDSRRRAEELGSALRELGVTTFLSHSSLSAAQRRESEAAFAGARGCVIVSTSTLELGIDVGDLDRVIQIDSPHSVSSFLQRLGRTGRRPGTTRNCLFLCLEPEALLTTLAMLLKWRQGWVEPVVPPPVPRHIAAQQILAASLAGHGLPLARWTSFWGDLPLMTLDGAAILANLLEQDFLDQDGVYASIGAQAEKVYGRRHFMELLAVFTAPPQFTVLAGRVEIGTIGVELLLDERPGGHVLLLGGRSWRVNHIDWNRRQCFVELVASGGRAKWTSFPDGLSYALTSGMREILLGSDPDGVTLTRRAIAGLADVRADLGQFVSATGFVLQRTPGGDWYWWTWAGERANRTLAAWLPELVDPVQRTAGNRLRLRATLSRDEIAAGLNAARENPPLERLPPVDPRALRGLKFADCLPPALAADTVGQRLADADGALAVLQHTAAKSAD